VTAPARNYLRSAASLGLVALLGTALLAGVREWTADRIAEQERRVIREQLEQVLAGASYDNDLQQDFVIVADETYFPGGQEVVAYRARLAGEPVAVVLRFEAVNGYNGRIGLLAGIDLQGRLSGVRVVSHRETPGLGDGIEVERSDWILAFDGKSLQDPAEQGWRVRRDGGSFDQFTGATITPRAVVAAVRRALQYYALQRDRLINGARAGDADTA